MDAAVVRSYYNARQRKLSRLRKHMADELLQMHQHQLIGYPSHVAIAAVYDMIDDIFGTWARKGWDPLAMTSGPQLDHLLENLYMAETLIDWVESYDQRDHRG